MKRLLVALAVLLLSGLGAVYGQSLAELAKKEKERRNKNAIDDAPSFDESSLRGRGRTVAPPVPTPPQAGEEAETSSAEAEEPAEEEEEEGDPAKTEAYWRNRLAPIDRRIADIRSRLNAPGFAQDPTNLLQRQRLEQDLERALADRQSIVEEARRKGIPPGWLR